MTLSHIINFFRKMGNDLLRTLLLDYFKFFYSRLKHVRLQVTVKWNLHTKFKYQISMTKLWRINSAQRDRRTDRLTNGQKHEI